jgi:hypothetical protein
MVGTYRRIEGRSIYIYISISCPQNPRYESDSEDGGSSLKQERGSSFNDGTTQTALDPLLKGSRLASSAKQETCSVGNTVFAAFGAAPARRTAALSRPEGPGHSARSQRPRVRPLSGRKCWPQLHFSRGSTPPSKMPSALLGRLLDRTRWPASLTRACAGRPPLR